MGRPKNLTITEFREKLLEIIIEKPDIKDVVLGASVLLLVGINLNIESRRGKVIELRPYDVIVLEFPSETLITHLKFYGLTWGLIK